MTLNTASIIADVTAALAEVGYDVVLVQDAALNPSPWDTAPPLRQTTLRVMDSKILRRRNQGSEVQDGRTILCAPGDNVPSQGDRILMRDKTYEVMVVRPIAPSGVDVLFAVELQ